MFGHCDYAGCIITTDPINANPARWPKAELSQRFKVPVKCPVYSHGLNVEGMYRLIQGQRTGN